MQRKLFYTGCMLMRHIGSYLCATLCIIGIMSCSDRRDFKSPEMALEEYQLFMEGISSETSCTTEILSNYICQWQELSDTVYSYLAKTDELYNHGREDMFLQTCDSIRTLLLGLAGSGTYNYEDVVSVIISTNPFRADMSIDSVRTSVLPFFDSLDLTRPKDSGKERALQDYQGFVHSVFETGISNEEEFFRFLKFEDMLFRRYLYHLGELMGESMTQLTFETDSICRGVFNAPSIDGLTQGEVMANMAVRTGRRLLQNARAACDCLSHDKDMEPDKSAALVWMAVQPFISIDSFTLALMTEEQIHELHEIAVMIPGFAEQKDLLDDNIRRLVSNLPSQILKLYITRL